MIRESWIGDHVELSQVRQCSLAGVSRATVYACWRRLNIDHLFRLNIDQGRDAVD